LTVEQAIGGAGTSTVIFNTLGPGTYYSNSTGIFKPGRKGYYQVSASLRLSTVAGGYAVLRFLVNDAEYANPAFLTSGAAGSTLAGSDLVYLDANDELKIALVSGGACAIQIGNNFSSKFHILEIKP
jgi:hypothetical protein